MDQREKYLAMKAKADEEFAKSKKQSLFERKLRNEIWEGKKLQAMTPRALSQLEGRGYEPPVSGEKRPGEKLGKGWTKGMEKTDLDWAKQLNEEQREKNGELRRNDRSREV